MSDSKPLGDELSRRTMLGSGLAAMLGLAGAADAREVWRAVKSGHSAPAGAAARQPFLDAFADTVIPTTDTPGAKSVGTSKFVELMISHSPNPKEITDFHAGLDLIRAELQKRGGAPFEQLALAKREAVLEALDREILTGVSGKDYAAAYSKLKGLIVYGYYTSEVGGSQELRYELVPGRFDADIPYDPNARAYSNLG